MRVLIVAATDAEISPLTPHVRGDVDVLVTGVGMVATAARTAQVLSRTTYGLALNVGVCGAFDALLGLGTVVHVVADRLSELGVEDGESFVPIQELPLAAEAAFTNESPPALPALCALPAVSGITVNTVHGSARSIAETRRRFTPQVESMEGAAFMCACALSGVPYAQVRAVSNLVEPRRRSAWRLAEAIDALVRTVPRILDQACH
jgi:futalosine hydrolase